MRATCSRVPLALVLSSFDMGGTERQMVELALRLDPARFAVEIACFARRGPLLDRVVGAGIPIREFGLRGGFYRPAAWRQMRAFAAWCRARRVAVLQTTDFYTNIFALPSAAAARVPVRIGSRRELKTEKTAARLALQRGAYAAAHMVVANSHAAAGQLSRERVPGAKITVVSNGLDIDRFAPREIQNVRRVVTVANLRWEKAHDVFVDAAVRLLARHPEVEFLIAGDGPERDGILRRVTAAGAGERIRLLGHVGNVPALLAASDLFVLPSRSEAFPNALLEAMAAGLPVVATSVGGIPELVTHGRTGLLVPVDDAVALGEAIHQLLGDAAQARALGQAARAAVADRYSFDRMVAAFEDVYDGQLARRGETGPARLAAARP